MTTIGFLHTSPVHVPTFDGLVRDADATATTVHEVQDELLDRARHEGPGERLEQATLLALEALVDRGADVVVCTCSTLGAIAEGVGSHSRLPVLRVDRPMARHAVAAGSRIAVVAALESTLGPTTALLADEARRAGKAPSITSVCASAAWSAFETGDTDSYLRQVDEAARSLAADADVVVLAQASMMGAVATLGDLPVPVLSSPPLAVRHALDLAAELDQRESSTITS